MRKTLPAAGASCPRTTGTIDDIKPLVDSPQLLLFLASRAGGTQPDARTTPPRSVAVLPFVSISVEKATSSSPMVFPKNCSTHSRASAISPSRRALEVEPTSAVLHLIAGNVAFNLNDLEGTQKHYRLLKTYGLSDGVNGSSFYELAAGNFERAAEMMALAQFNDQRISADDAPRLEQFFLGIMQREHDVDSRIDEFPTLAGDDDFLVPAYMISGESEKALRLLASDPMATKTAITCCGVRLIPICGGCPISRSSCATRGLPHFGMSMAGMVSP